MKFGEGAVNAAEIILGVGDVAEIVFLCDPELPPFVRELLIEMGRVVELRANLDVVVEELRSLGVEGITTSADRGMEQCAVIAERMGLPFNSRRSVRYLTDKTAQRDQFRRGGVDDVRSARLLSVADWREAVRHVGLPAVLKPASGSGSSDSYLIRDADLGRRLAASLIGRDDAGLVPFVLEEYLQGRPCRPFGDYVSVESLVRGDQIEHFAVTGNFAMVLPFREIGHFWPSTLPDSELRRIVELTSVALRTLDVTHGLAHTEFKLTPDGPRLIEVNGRLGGFVHDLARRAWGIDLVEVATRAALGMEVPRFPRPPTDVHFQYSSPLPAGSCRLDAVHGVRELRRITGVVGYRPLVQLGVDVGPSVMTRRIDMVFGHACDHQHMMRVLEEALPCLRYELTLTGRRVSMTAADLMDLAMQDPPG